MDTVVGFVLCGRKGVLALVEDCRRLQEVVGDY